MLKTNVLDKIKENKRLKFLLCLKNSISENSLNRWLNNNDEKLTMLKNLEIISQETNTPINELIQ